MMKVLATTRRCRLTFLILAGTALLAGPRQISAADTAPGPRPSVTAPDGWTAAAPRDEIRPDFSFDARGGPDGKGGLVITADRREGLAGYWKKTFPIAGGKHLRFAAVYRATGVSVPRRNVAARWKISRATSSAASTASSDRSPRPRPACSRRRSR